MREDSSLKRGRVERMFYTPYPTFLIHFTPLPTTHFEYNSNSVINLFFTIQTLPHDLDFFLPSPTPQCKLSSIPHHSFLNGVALSDYVEIKCYALGVRKCVMSSLEVVSRSDVEHWLIVSDERGARSPVSRFWPVVSTLDTFICLTLICPSTLQCFSHNTLK